MRTEQLQRYGHYLRRYLHHATPIKISNLLRVESRFLRNQPNLNGLYPHYLVVEVSNSCNLSCPLCQMGRHEVITRKNSMNIEQYIRCVEPLKDYLFQVVLYDWGEPFLNSAIYDIIEWNTQNNIASIVSTNANIDIDAERLIKTGLEYLIISGDGVTQDVYEKYRRGGNISKVFANLEKIVYTKKMLKKESPVIEWQCLVTKHNEHQLHEIEKTVYKKGVNWVRFGNINFFSAGKGSSIEDEWLPNNPKFRQITRHKPTGDRKPCFWLWRSAVINVNGGVTPCCLYDIPDWANCLEDDFLSIWNGDIYQEARKRSQNDTLSRKNRIICDTCTANFIYK